MGVLLCRLDVRVPEERLDLVDRRAALDEPARVRVAEAVEADLLRQPREAPVDREPLDQEAPVRGRHRRPSKHTPRLATHATSRGGAS